MEGSDTSPAAGQRGSGRKPRDDALVYGPLAVLVLALLAFAGYGLKVPGAPWAGGVAVVAIAGCVAARLRNGPTTVSLWWFIAISLSAVWLGWTRFLNIRLVIVWLPLAVGAIGFGLAYPRVCNRHAQRVREAERRAEEAERIARELAIKNHWPMLLERIGHPGVKIVGRKETASGYVLSLRLPSSGRVTITKLRGDAERLEVAADTRRGSLYFEEGTTARDVLLHVTERDFLAETIPYEDNGEVLSIHNPIPIGRYEDGTICELTLREIAVLIVGLRGSGKALALDTPVPTLAGWTTMGEIRVGDILFDETGAPCRATDVWEVRHDRPCYRIRFSDGSVIVADADHQWFVDTDASRRSASAQARGDRRPRKTSGIQWNHGQQYRRKMPEIVTTAGMIGSLRSPRRSGSTPDGGQTNYSVRVAGPLQCPAAELPVPPYTMGAWLGDGTTITGSVTTADPEIIAEIEREGEKIWAVPSTVKTHHASYRVADLNVRLRRAGVLGNKHIPAAYLRASEPQRRALLAGLLDTDGYCDKRGSVEFCSTRERLARDVYHLVSSLGYKAGLRVKRARLYEKDCGTVWTVSFTPADKVFRLPRKVARQVTRTRSSAAHRYIVAIEPVPSVPVRCIAVDSPSHLYLVGESCIPTHNSNLANVFIAQLARCVDVLVFCIDMKYRLAMPWVTPYLEDERHGLAVDWAATDRSEAERMLRAFVRGIGARAAAGQGEEKIEPEPARPAVFLVIDEIASIFGVGTGPKPSSNQATNTTLAALGTDAVRLGRSEAMDLIAVSQRGNVSMLGTGDFKSQFPLRIGLSVQNETEALSVIPDDKRAAKILASLKHEGTGLVQWREGRMMRVKFFRITPAQVGEIARRYGPMKPTPEPVLAEALGNDYVTRWERFRATRKAAVNATRAGPGNPTDRQFREIASRLGGVGHVDEDDLSEPRRRMREYIGRFGERGATLTMIVGLFGSGQAAADEHTVRRWLSDDIDRSVIELTPRGSYRLRTDDR